MTTNSKRFLQEQNLQLRQLIDSMLDYFQVIPQSSSSFKIYQRKLKIFEKHYSEIKRQSGDSV